MLRKDRTEVTSHTRQSIRSCTKGARRSAEGERKNDARGTDRNQIKHNAVDSKLYQRAEGEALLCFYQFECLQKWN